MRHIAKVAVILALTLSGCPQGPPLVNLPAAQTPVLETIFRPGASPRMIPFGPLETWDILPAQKIVLRLRAPWPTNWKISIDNIDLQQVTDSNDHPELNAGGYFNTGSPVVIDNTDPSYFWQIVVSLPQAKWNSASAFRIFVTNISQNTTLPQSQQIAKPLIIDVPAVSEATATKPSDVFFDGDGSLDKSIIVQRDVTLAGWLVAEPVEKMPERNAPGHAEQGETEDFHYDLYLDDDFIARNYAPNAAQLIGAILPGRAEFHGVTPIALLNGPIDAGTFLMPGLGVMTVELNSWHTDKRGPPPPNWVMDPDPTFPRDAWPFDPTRPFTVGAATGPLLSGDDYVIMSGALVEDTAHIDTGGILGGPCNLNDPKFPNCALGRCWDDQVHGHGGWLEIHPVDSIRTLENAPGQVGPPAVRKHVNQVVSACGEFGLNNNAQFLAPITPQPAGTILEYREEIDPRFTDMSTVTSHIVQACTDTSGPKLHVSVTVAPGGRFKAVYVVWWQTGQQSYPSCGITVLPH